METVYGTDMDGSDNMMQLDKATYGCITYFYGVDAANTASELTSQAWNMIALVGHKQGKGIAIAMDYSGYDTTFPMSTVAFTDNATSGIVSFSAPAGGVAQFKGLLQDTTADKYVEVLCNGI